MADADQQDELLERLISLGEHQSVLAAHVNAEDYSDRVRGVVEVPGLLEFEQRQVTARKIADVAKLQGSASRAEGRGDGAGGADAEATDPSPKQGTGGERVIAGLALGSDNKRYFRGNLPRLAMITIIAMPLLYCALYLWTFWNPFNEVERIPAAVVNLDRGAKEDGKPFHAGKQVVSNLIKSGQLGVEETSEQKGTAGSRRRHLLLQDHDPAGVQQGDRFADRAERGPGRA